MNKFQQHIPNFAQDIRDPLPPVYEFETTEDLLALEVVRRYGKDKKFSHFALSDNCLMEISDEGFHWWVVGYIKEPNSLDLPKWEGWKYRVELPDGRKVVLGKEVISSCGGVLTLRDGTRQRI